MTKYVTARSGFATLTIVFFISFVLAMITLTVLTITLFRVNLAQANIQEKVVFYSTESMLYDVLMRMNRTYNISNGTYGWPPVGSAAITSNGITYERIFTNKNTTPPTYSLSIIGKNRYAARQLIADINMGMSTAENDIVLVIDVSGSMDDQGTHTCTDWNNLYSPQGIFSSTDCTKFGTYKISFPIYAAEAAATYFVSLIQSAGPPVDTGTQIGVVLYSYEARLTKPLDKDLAATQSVLTGLTSESGTNTHHALQMGIQELLSGINQRSSAKKSLILLTDGSPNHYNKVGDPNNPDTDGCSNFKLDNLCSTLAISVASDNKSAITFYSIGLGFDNNSLTDEQRFLQSVATDNSHAFFLGKWTGSGSTAELQNLYGQILVNILSGTKVTITEQGAQ